MTITPTSISTSAIPKKVQLISIVLETNDDGYLAHIPSIQGAFAEGDTPEEAIFNCLDVLAMIRDYRANDNSLISFPNLELNAQNNVTITIPIAS